MLCVWVSRGSVWPRFGSQLASHLYSYSPPFRLHTTRALTFGPGLALKPDQNGCAAKKSKARKFDSRWGTHQTPSPPYGRNLAFIPRWPKIVPWSSSQDKRGGKKEKEKKKKRKENDQLTPLSNFFSGMYSVPTYPSDCLTGQMGRRAGNPCGTSTPEDRRWRREDPEIRYTHTE